MPSEIAVPSTRVRWTIRPDEASSDGVLAPAALVARVVSEARLLTTGRASVSVEELKVLAPVRVGAELIITCAVERERGDGAVVSVAARRGEAGAHGGLAAVGVLRFTVSGARASWLTAAGLSATLGATPVEARFKARAEALSADVLGRVHELALVSAQGFVGGPVRFDLVHSLTTLAPLEPTHWLQLQCSVVHAEGSRLAVLSHLIDLDEELDVSCALMTFQSTRPVPPLRALSNEGRALFHQIGRQLAS